jgi:hypothetical protein
MRSVTGVSLCRAGVPKSCSTIDCMMTSRLPGAARAAPDQALN